MGPGNEFGDAKAAGSHHCEAAVNQLKCQGNQSRFLMTGKKPNVTFSSQKDEEGELQDVQPDLIPTKSWSKTFLESISSSAEGRR